jgi:tryptophan synthase alpha chain
MPYVCCGDPNEKFTMHLVSALVTSGAGAIELGIPFSDPIADGKTIAAASGRALSGGMTPKKAIAIIAKIRKSGIEVPIIVMTYYNVVYAAGTSHFLSAIKAAGADGLIIPDAPIEESGSLRKLCKFTGIDFIQLITPNCSDSRLKKIASVASGFLYAVSVLGTTGARKNVSADAISLVKRAKGISRLPVAVGFGISKPAHACAFANAGADGIIVGSEIVNIYSKYVKGRKIDEKRALSAVSRFARKMANACTGKN